MVEHAPSEKEKNQKKSQGGKVSQRRGEISPREIFSNGYGERKSEGRA